MGEFRYLFGPVPSRRLGRSLGVSPIEGKTCNYSCVYCQLGRTNHMTNTRRMFYPVAEILKEFEEALVRNPNGFDIVTVVGEGEPTLYLGLGALIDGIHARTEKPVAVITNGALLYDAQVRTEVAKADIVLPSLDAYDAETFRKIDRPIGTLRFDQVERALIDFTHAYTGQIWIEIMLVGGMNDDDAALGHFRALLGKLRYDRVYVNTPVRPPAEDYVRVSEKDRIEKACALFGAVSIDMLTSGSFSSEITDDYEAICSIIRRHPMNRFEIAGFLSSRGEGNAQAFFDRLEQDPAVETVRYKEFVTYRSRQGGK